MVAARLVPLSICQNHGSGIDLLLTDLVMPDISGNKLCEQLKELKPDMQILFMSGYTEDVIEQFGVHKEDVNFITKPFSIEGLAKKVHQILNS